MVPGGTGCPLASFTCTWQSSTGWPRGAIGVAGAWFPDGQAVTATVVSVGPYWLSSLALVWPATVVIRPAGSGSPQAHSSLRAGQPARPPSSASSRSTLGVAAITVTPAVRASAVRCRGSVRRCGSASTTAPPVISGAYSSGTDKSKLYLT